MSEVPLSDEQIIAKIEAGGSQRESCINYIYKQFFGFFHQAKSRHALSEDELLSCYNDAILVFSSNIVKGSFKGESKCSSYFFRIFNNKCIDHFRKNTTYQTKLDYEIPEHIRESAPDIADLLEIQAETRVLKALMDKLGEKCRNILMDWAYWGYKMEEIAQRYGLKDKRVAASTKFNCLAQLKKLIKKHNNL